MTWFHVMVAAMVTMASLLVPGSDAVDTSQDVLAVSGSHGTRYATIKSFKCSGPGCCKSARFNTKHKCGCGLGLPFGLGINTKAAKVEVRHRWEDASWGSALVEDHMVQCKSFTKDDGEPADASTRNLLFRGDWIFNNTNRHRHHHSYFLGSLSRARLDMHISADGITCGGGGTPLIRHNPEVRGCVYRNLKSSTGDITDIELEEYIECDQDFYGSDCSTFCTSESTCHSNGHCHPDTGQCVCGKGYVLDDCSEFCLPETQCSGKGACRVNFTTTHAVCDCQTPYRGNDCSCSDEGTCNGNGACNMQENGDVIAAVPCVCKGNYEGTYCNISRGTCEDTCDMNNTKSCFKAASGAWKCACSPHAKGERCDVPCTCVQGICSIEEGGQCDAKVNCNNPYVYGPNCDKACTCLYGQCNSGVHGDGTCMPGTCKEKYWGENCDLTCHCIEGRCPSQDNASSSDVVQEDTPGLNECSICNNNWYGAGCYHRCDCIHGTCIDGLFGNGSCVVGSCVDDYGGVNCNIDRLNQTNNDISGGDAKKARTFLGLFTGLTILVALVGGIGAVMYHKKVFCFSYRIPIMEEADELVYVDVDDDDVTGDQAPHASSKADYGDDGVNDYEDLVLSAVGEKSFEDDRDKDNKYDYDDDDDDDDDGCEATVFSSERPSTKKKRTTKKGYNKI